MAQPIIRVENISKLYRLGKKDERPPTLIQAALRFGSAPLRNFRQLRSLTHFEDAANATDILWALRDVSFDVAQGEVVGLIGHNGAGKSTLLKILSRIMPPTKGRAEIHGRLASLLEVGTGFHPELSGRDNIFLNGAILGMTRREIARKFDEIVAFSEIEKFIDTPVKRYSSGMYVRLAFAVAAHLEPEILILDEVLAVGDTAFQKKCLGKMDSAAKEGRTILFVSHNLQAVSTLCSRVILFDKGQVVMNGIASNVINHYLAKHQVAEKTEWKGNEGDDNARLLHTWVRPTEDEGIFHTATELEVGVEVNLLKKIEGLILGFRIISEYGTILLYTLFDDAAETDNVTHGPGKLTKKFYIPKDFLGEGQYQIGFCIGIHQRKSIIHLDHGNLNFSLINTKGIGRLHLGVSGQGFQSLLRPRLKTI